MSFPVLWQQDVCPQDHILSRRHLPVSSSFSLFSSCFHCAFPSRIFQFHNPCRIPSTCHPLYLALPCVAVGTGNGRGFPLLPEVECKQSAAGTPRGYYLWSAFSRLYMLEVKIISAVLTYFKATHSPWFPQCELHVHRSVKCLFHKGTELPRVGLLPLTYILHFAR
jgi:hypothetical protein